MRGEEDLGEPLGRTENGESRRPQTDQSPGANKEMTSEEVARGVKFEFPPPAAYQPAESLPSLVLGSTFVKKHDGGFSA